MAHGLSHIVKIFKKNALVKDFSLKIFEFK
jgi:hypothetical protein